ncbi:MAG TPA: DUF1491 family protein [Afifellaceae bacterium]|nr:DUF1491 family protein [Afifellaceae bacterium]
MRLRSDIWVSWLLRRVEADGAYVTVARRGAAEAGAVYIVLDRRDGTFDLLAPAPQATFDDPSPERVFERLLDRADSGAVESRLAQELRFDSDLWVIEIEDREGRPFVEMLRFS